MPFMSPHSIALPIASEDENASITPSHPHQSPHYCSARAPILPAPSSPKSCTTIQTPAGPRKITDIKPCHHTSSFRNFTTRFFFTFSSLLYRGSAP